MTAQPDAGEETEKSCVSHKSIVAATALLLCAFAHGQIASPNALAPWLDVPAAWTRTVQNGAVGVSPNDLPLGR